MDASSGKDNNLFTYILSLIAMMLSFVYDNGCYFRNNSICQHDENDIRHANDQIKKTYY